MNHSNMQCLHCKSESFRSIELLGGALYCANCGAPAPEVKETFFENRTQNEYHHLGHEPEPYRQSNSQPEKIILLIVALITFIPVVFYILMEIAMWAMQKIVDLNSFIYYKKLQLETVTAHFEPIYLCFTVLGLFGTITYFSEEHGDSNKENIIFACNGIGITITSLALFFSAPSYGYGLLILLTASLVCSLIGLIVASLIDFFKK